MEYKESEYLLISGIQHFSFCRRQWALIHIEQQWSENFRTVDGELMHQRVHNSNSTELRGDILSVRGMTIASRRLGVSGACDLVEFKRDSEGISLFGRDGKWNVFPVEYKRGSSKIIDADRLQLCLQAICLEEMLCCHITTAHLYYGETHHRETVYLTKELRESAESMVLEMHELFQRGNTPKVKPTRACNACSLKEQCLPKLTNKKTVKRFIDEMMEASLCDSY